MNSLIKGIVKKIIKKENLNPNSPYGKSILALRLYQEIEKLTKEKTKNDNMS